MHIDDAGKRLEVGVAEPCSVLDVLQAQRIDIQATCGGVGKCGRCQVLVRDDEGLSYRLACMTPVSDGMEVVVEHAGAMDVVQSGTTAAFPPDEGATGYGLAIDIGTTTVVAHLHDLATGERLATVGRANPQIAFGSDVISRISASVDGKLDLMTGIIQDAMREMKAKLCATAGVDPAQVVRCAIAGNTVMQHIAVGLPPDTIGYNPFIPQSLFGDVHDIDGLGPCYFARCIAGYVGGDITAGMLACELDEGGTRLFLDLGTNGEMALAANGRIWCCATAAGPVFEGANIHFGMPASPGAISKVTFEDGEVKIGVVGDVAPIGICGTGIVDAVALMVRLGVVDDTGYLLGADELEEPLASFAGRENDRNVFYLTPDHSIYITQNDVRSLQLAKAAVCAGILTMVEAAGIQVSDIKQLEIAGGFGAYLNLKSAAGIGLFPKELLSCASSVGNTSGEGATALLVSSAARTREDVIVEKCDYLELSTSSEFNEFYVEMMEFE
ncbi:MAG: DUF4445 domain-containing protein [Eggerthellaceae bacterium]|nr:DUF4445 domain-containing protein [Eggerthellaceae bacterium]